MIGIIGLGFVGGAMYKSFQEKGVDVKGYDKYKDGGIGSLSEMLECAILFLCLPTLYNVEKKEYDKSAIHEICTQLATHDYAGIVVIKSTVEPETTQKVSSVYPHLRIIHNPEFLTARTAYHDFHHQKHIVLGRGPNCNTSHINVLTEFYQKYYPDAEVSQCTSLESESMKIFCNSFYASKIQLFNEYYMLCQQNGSDYNRIRDLMLKNEWINEMHTQVPGPDGKLGYGGACFPKDTNALQKYMEGVESPCDVLKSVIVSRNRLRHNITEN